MPDNLVLLDRRLADIRLQDGGLPHAAGVQSFQVLRANRAHPDMADGFGWTYNHAPMLAYYHGRLYLEYLSNPVSEHETPGQTLLTSSANGFDWDFPKVVFPPIEVPTAPYRGPGSPLAGDTILTVPHQRMGFYRAHNDVLLVLSFYGIVHDRHQSMPCDGWGVGRAVRRIFPDGSVGDIFFLMYNTPAGYTAENTGVFAHYAKCPDKDFVAACRELLSDTPVMRQMYEEQRFDRELFPEPSEQALSFYSVSDSEMIGVYKRGLAHVSHDGGKTWGEITPNPTIRTATGKVWGQRTSDGGFALLYNPTPDGQHRWPIAVATGTDGHTFDRLLAITGFMSPQRYGGLDKNLGPQYMRGICERNPQTPDGDIWLAYSNNKEDIWISRIPVPVTAGEAGDISEDFAGMEAFPRGWSIYSPAWAPVRMVSGTLTLTDEDPYDRAAVERMLPPARAGEIALRLCVESVTETGAVCVELQDDSGGVPMRVSFRCDGQVYVRADGRTEPRWRYSPGKAFTLRIAYDCAACRYSVSMDGQQGGYTFSASVLKIARLCVATKELWQIPYATADTVGKYGTKEQVLPGSEVRARPQKARIFGFWAKRNEDERQNEHEAF